MDDTTDVPKMTPTSPSLNASSVDDQHRNKNSSFHSEPEMPDAKSQRFPVGGDYNTVPTYPLRPSYKDFHSQLRSASRVVVFDGSPDDPYRPTSVPIYQTATFEQPCATEYGAYDYTRSGSPTRTALERQVAMLENAHAAFAFTSGMAALNSITRLLKAGDTLIVGSDIYGGMHRLVNRVTAVQGVTVKMVETWDLNAVRKVLDEDPNVTLVHMETPSNPLMRITDIRALSDVLKPKGIILSVDSTMMTPLLQQPINHGADVVCHSMTKFFGGHSDTMGGVVCVATEALAKKIAFFQNAEGTGLAPFDCWLFLRGIKTLSVRVQQAQANAMDVAHFLLRHPLPVIVFYAGVEPDIEEMLKNSQRAQDYKIHSGQAKGGGSVISFTTGSVEISKRVIDNLRLFKLTVSFGSCNSLCEMPAMLSHASIPAHERTLPDDLIRLAIGIEDVNDLLEDLQRSFSIALLGETGISSTPVNGGLPLLDLSPSASQEVYLSQQNFRVPTTAASNNQKLVQASPRRSSSGTNGVPIALREKSTMHTLDRTKPELPPSERKMPRKFTFTPQVDSESVQALNSELALLRGKMEAHEKNRALLLSFTSGLMISGAVAYVAVKLGKI